MSNDDESRYQTGGSSMTEANEEIDERNVGSIPWLARSEDRPPCANWWKDVQAWQTSLWRAAFLRSAFNVACNNGATPTTNLLNCLVADQEQVHTRIGEKPSSFPHCPLLVSNELMNMEPTTPHPSRDNGHSSAPNSTLLLVSTPTPRTESDNVSGQQQQEPTLFTCNVPANLTNGQQIRIVIGDTTFDVVVNAVKAAACQAGSASQTANSFGRISRAKDICKELKLDNTLPHQRTDAATFPQLHPFEANLPKLSRSSQNGEIRGPAHVTKPLHSASAWSPELSSDVIKSSHLSQTRPRPCQHRRRAPFYQGDVNKKRKRETSTTRNADASVDDPKMGTSEDDANSISKQEMSTSVIDGVNLEEIRQFAKLFKMKRLSLGLTQTQVGQTLSLTNGPAYSQSAICRFEKLDITPKSAQKIKPVLERWLQEVEDQIKSNGGIANIQRPFVASVHTDSKKPNDQNAIQAQWQQNELDTPPADQQSIDIDYSKTSSIETVSSDAVAVASASAGDNAASCKRRKRRTSFTPQALDLLNDYFEKNSHPSGMEMTSLAERLNYDREVIRVWFCNKRQALKNTIKKRKTSV